MKEKYNYYYAGFILKLARIFLFVGNYFNDKARKIIFSYEENENVK